MRRVSLGLTLLMFVFSAIGTAQVSIVSPRDGETVRSRWLNVKVEKPTQRGYVMIWFNGKFITAITHPFELRMDLAEQNVFSGTHTLKVAGFDENGRKEGETQVQFRVDLAGETESVRLVFKPQTGELNFYTFQATSEATVDIPAKAIRQKVPQLSTKLTLRWFQTVRDITVDRQYRMMRIVEDGILEREIPITMGGGLAMGGPAGLMGGLGPMGMFGGEEVGGAIGQMGMIGMPGRPTMPGASLATASTRVRFRPIDDQKVSLFVLFPNGNIVTSEEMPNVVKFTTNSLDISVPERELKIGERWIGFITLPRNLENLTIVGATTAGMGGMPMMGGMPGEEFSELTGMPGMMGGPMGRPMMPGGQMMPGGPAMGMPGRPGMPGALGAPMMPGMPGQLGAPMMPGMPGQPGAPAVPGMPGAIQEPEVFLADAPVTTVPAVHKFDGFEFWNERLCARIVSEFKAQVELDLAPIIGIGQMGLGGMYGGAPGMPGMMGGQMMPGGQMTPGTPGIGGMSGNAPVGPSGQPSQTQTKLIGDAEGSRTLLFDIENGRVVYVKVKMKATFNTYLLTVLPFVQSQLTQQQQLAGALGGQTTLGGAVGGMPSGAGFGPSGMLGGPMGGFGMPGGAGFGPSGMLGGPMGGFGMPGGVGLGPGGMWGGPMGGFGMPGGEFGIYGGAGGGAPTTPSMFGRFGLGTSGTTPGGLGMGAPVGPGLPQQPTFRNHPAKLVYSFNVENSLTHSGRLDQQLKILGER